MCLAHNAIICTILKSGQLFSSLEMLQKVNINIISITRNKSERLTKSYYITPPKDTIHVEH